ncbi:M36 family metallopeptidase [Streptomyces sp. NPDC048349]|uniref:M36 family metallopeptidase n=1 Tax=Streptomyces sp. NPDC048349 TaxID=3155486 RepID=UPI00342A1243
MTTLIDKRDMTYDRFEEVAGSDGFLADTARERVAEEVHHSLIADPNKVNRFTGHLGELRADGAPAFESQGSAAPGATPDSFYIHRAKEYVDSVSEAIGFAADEPAEFQADPSVTATSAGMRVVSLQQMLNGIEVWGMAPKVWLLEDGTVERVVGDTASVPADLPVTPVVSAETALAVAAAKAAEAVTLEGPFGTDELPALDISQGFRCLSAQPGNNQPLIFSNGPFEEAVPARLVYLYMGKDVRLTWFFTFSRKNLVVQYHAFVEAAGQGVDAESPQILYFYDATDRVVAGTVFKHNPNEGALVQVTFPPPLTDYPTLVPAGLPEGFPDAWTNPTNGTVATQGNNVRAFGGNNLPFEVQVGTGGGVFNPLANSPEHLVTSIFYFCNYMHDFFMMLGFTEEFGNFQKVNVTGRGKGADPVNAFARPVEIEGTATMATRADGLAAEMNMGLVEDTNRHTALDADVVYHEFCHGVSNRLVGGLADANGLREQQSRSMGEGWGDFFALSIINFSRAQERTVLGNWVIDDPRGIRNRPYDSQYPGTFAHIGLRRGQVPGNPDLNYREVHNVGEIWCATLMELIRKTTTALGSKERGYRVVWQAVVDGMKLTPRNPSFLAARDAILGALKAMEGGALTSAEYTAVRTGAWEAFARFAMGFDAVSTNASFDGCRGGVDMPPPGSQD